MTNARPRPTRIVALIAAHNEEQSLPATLESLRNQERRPDQIVVALDNCSDSSRGVVSSTRGVRFFRTRGNAHKKPGALNRAWHRYCRNADLVVCIDADTQLPPTALRDWEREFAADPSVGGVSAKFTMLVDEHMTRRERMLVSLQRAEFAKWTDLALRRKRRTSVLAGTACCFRNDALRAAAATRDDGRGPWKESSLVEDFELTYLLRQLGWATKVSGQVRAYTDAMPDVRSLWAQRMKWQVGTVEELLNVGVNRLTLFDWWQQLQGGIALVVRALWIVLLVLSLVLGVFRFQPLWLLAPVVFVANDVRQSFRIPHSTPYDRVLAASLLPQECFAWMRAAWFAASWYEALRHRWFGRPHRDRWSLQAAAENVGRLEAQPAR